MNTPLISVIVPIYNVEKFLPECIESILAQTYTNLEIILVDDGSPDNCGAICDAYAAKDSRVKVIHKPNGGLSAARNAGLDIARGGYIGFVDSDDCVEVNMFEKLLETALREEADLTICNACMVDEAGNKMQEFPTNDRELRGIVSPEEMLELLINNPNTKYVVAWNKLFARKLFDNCRFPEGKLNEDSYVMHRLYGNSQKIVFIPDALYHYRMRQGSIMRSALTVRHLDVVEALTDRMDLLRSMNCDALARQVLSQAISLLFSTYSQIREKDAALRKRVFQLRKELLSIARGFRLSAFDWKTMVKILLLFLFPVKVWLKR